MVMAVELSLVTCCYNSGRFLRQTIDSGLIALGNITYEWIFVDDRSPDDTVAIIDSYGNSAFRVIRHGRNQGPLAAMATGVGASLGRYVVILDHDDLVPEGSMSARLSKMRDGASAVFGAVEYVNADGRPYRTVAFDGQPRELSGIPGLLSLFRRPTWPLKQGAVMFRRDLWVLEHGFDIPFLLDLVRDGRVAFVPETVLGYRTYRGQYSGRRLGRLKNLFRFFWARQALRVLPFRWALPVAAYKTGIEVAKVLWVQISDRK